MENYFIISENAETWANLLPLTFTRPTADLRCGILTNAERWQALLGSSFGWQAAAPYLSEIFGSPQRPDCTTLFVDGSVIATEDIAKKASQLLPGQALVDNDFIIAHRGGDIGAKVPWTHTPAMRLRYCHDIFRLAAEAIDIDFRILAHEHSQPLSGTNTVVGDSSKVYLAPGAKAECAVFNTTAGPIYLGPDSEVMEGALLRGPIALCEGSTINMGAKIYGATVIGPHCKAGGEINNVVFHSYSNKAHDGFLGNAVIGQWCNLGAGAVASNLKNNYAPIKLWNYPSQRFLPTGLQFCGLIMGDHSKAGINTMFNTATVLGIGVNVHQTGFPRNFIPSFSDGGAVSGFTEVRLSEFLETARRVMSRRNCTITPAMERMFTAIKDGDYRDLL